LLSDEARGAGNLRRRSGNDYCVKYCRPVSSDGLNGGLRSAISNIFNGTGDSGSLAGMTKRRKVRNVALKFPFSEGACLDEVQIRGRENLKD
jgi:hypothetical protein